MATGRSLASRMLAKHKRVNLSELNVFFEDPSRPLIHSATEDQVADIMTKGVFGPTIAAALKMLGMIVKNATEISE